MISRKVQNPSLETSFQWTHPAPMHFSEKRTEFEICSQTDLSIKSTYEFRSQCNGKCSSTFEFTGAFFRNHAFLEKKLFCTACGVSVDYLKNVFEKLNEFKGLGGLHVDYSCILLEACIAGDFFFILKIVNFPKILILAEKEKT